MGKLTKSDIGTLVEAAKAHLAETIEREAISQLGGGETIGIDVQIRIGADDYAPKEMQGVTDCRWICFTIGGTRYCFKYCY